MLPEIAPWIVHWTCEPTEVAVECTEPAADSMWNSVGLIVRVADCDRTCCWFVWCTFSLQLLGYSFGRLLIGNRLTAEW